MPILNAVEKNQLVAALTELMGRIVIEQNLFQNHTIPLPMLVYLANDLIKTLAAKPQKKPNQMNLFKEYSIIYKQFRGQALTAEEEEYDQQLHEIDVWSEVLNGVKYATSFSLAQNLYKSVTSAIGQNLWEHVPTIIGSTAAVTAGPAILTQAIAKVLAKSPLSETQKNFIQPWLNTVGRLCLALTPRVSATDEGVAYHYPAASSHIELIKKENYAVLENTANLLPDKENSEIPTRTLAFELKTVQQNGSIEEKVFLIIENERVEIPTNQNPIISEEQPNNSLSLFNFNYLLPSSTWMVPLFLQYQIQNAYNINSPALFSIFPLSLAFISQVAAQKTNFYTILQENYGTQSNAMTKTSDGAFAGTAHGGSVGSGLFKWDTNGTVLWMRLLPSSSGRYTFYDIAETNDQNLLASLLYTPPNTDDQFGVMKASANGTILFLNTIGLTTGGKGGAGAAICKLSSGNIIIGGVISGTPGSNTFGSKTVLARFDSVGNFISAQKIDTYFFPRSIKETQDGGIVVVGDSGYILKLSNTFTRLWGKIIGSTNFEAVTEAPDGNVWASGYIRYSPSGNDNLLLSKFSADGNLLLAKTLNGTDSRSCNAIQFNSAGHLIVPGYMTGLINTTRRGLSVTFWDQMGSLLNSTFFSTVNGLGAYARDFELVSDYIYTTGVDSIAISLARMNNDGTVGSCSYSHSVSLNATDLTNLLSISNFAFSMGAVNLTVTNWPVTGALYTPGASQSCFHPNPTPSSIFSSSPATTALPPTTAVQESTSVSISTAASTVMTTTEITTAELKTTAALTTTIPINIATSQPTTAALRTTAARSSTAALRTATSQATTAPLRTTAPSITTASSTSIASTVLSSTSELTPATTAPAENSTTTIFDAININSSSETVSTLSLGLMVGGGALFVICLSVTGALLIKKHNKDRRKIREIEMQQIELHRKQQEESRQKALEEKRIKEQQEQEKLRLEQEEKLKQEAERKLKEQQAQEKLRLEREEQRQKEEKLRQEAKRKEEEKRQNEFNQLERLITEIATGSSSYQLLASEQKNRVTTILRDKLKTIGLATIVDLTLPDKQKIRELLIQILQGMVGECSKQETSTISENINLALQLWHLLQGKLLTKPEEVLFNYKKLLLAQPQNTAINYCRAIFYCHLADKTSDLNTKVSHFYRALADYRLLKESNAYLKVQLQQLQRHLNQAKKTSNPNEQREKVRPTKSLADLQARKEALIKKQQHAQTNLPLLQKKHADLTQTITAKKQKLTVTRAKTDELKQKKQLQINKLAEKKQAANQLVTKKEQLQKKQKTLQEKKAALVPKKNNLATQKQTYENSLKQARAKVNSLKQQQETIKKQRDNKQAAIKNQQQKIQNQKNIIQNKLKEAEKIKRQKAQLTIDMKNEATERENLAAAVKKMFQAIPQIAYYIKTGYAQNWSNPVQSGINLLEFEKKVLKKRIDANCPSPIIQAQRQRVAQAEQTVQKLRRANDRLVIAFYNRSMRQQQDDFSDMNDEMQQDVVDDNYQDINYIEDTFDESLSEAQDQVEYLAETMDSFETELTDIEQDFGEVDNEYQEATEELNEANAELSEQQSEYNEVGQELNQVNQEIQSTDYQMNELNHDLIQQDTQLSAVQTDINNLEQQNDNVNHLIDSENANYESGNHEVQQLGQQENDLQYQEQSLQQDLTQTSRDIIEVDHSIEQWQDEQTVDNFWDQEEAVNEIDDPEYQQEQEAIRQEELAAENQTQIAEQQDPVNHTEQLNGPSEHPQINDLPNSAEPTNTPADKEPVALDEKQEASNAQEIPEDHSAQKEEASSGLGENPQSTVDTLGESSDIRDHNTVDQQNASENLPANDFENLNQQNANQVQIENNNSLNDQPSANLNNNDDEHQEPNQALSEPIKEPTPVEPDIAEEEKSVAPTETAAQSDPKDENVKSELSNFIKEQALENSDLSDEVKNNISNASELINRGVDIYNNITTGNWDNAVDNIKDTLIQHAPITEDARENIEKIEEKSAINLEILNKVMDSSERLGQEFSDQVQSAQMDSNPPNLSSPVNVASTSAQSVMGNDDAYSPEPTIDEPTPQEPIAEETTQQDTNEDSKDEQETLNKEEDASEETEQQEEQSLTDDIKEGLNKAGEYIKEKIEDTKESAKEGLANLASKFGVFNTNNNEGSSTQTENNTVEDLEEDINKTIGFGM